MFANYFLLLSILVVLLTTNSIGPLAWHYYIPFVVYMRRNKTIFGRYSAEENLNFDLFNPIFSLQQLLDRRVTEIEKLRPAEDSAEESFCKIISS